MFCHSPIFPWCQAITHTELVMDGNKRTLGPKINLVDAYQEVEGFSIL